MASKQVEEHDVTIERDWTIALVTPVTGVAIAWIEEHVPDPIWVSGSFACEPRYLGELCVGMIEAGLRLADTAGRALTVQLPDGTVL